MLVRRVSLISQWTTWILCGAGLSSALAGAQSKNPPPLLVAAYEGDAAKIQKLISDEHADVNASNDDGVTALMIAAGANKTDAMKVLLKSRADVSKKTKSGNTALIFAIGKGNKEAVSILLGAGASTSARTPDGLTLVELANQKQQAEIAQLLTDSIEAGGSPSSGPIYKPRTFPADSKAKHKTNEPNPELVATLESLKQTLLSSERVEYSWGPGNATRRWQQIINVVVDASDCQARVHSDSSINGRPPSDKTQTLFFESVDTVESRTQQDAANIFFSRHENVQNNSTYLGDLYVLAINDNPDPYSPLLFASEAQAKNIADLMSRAAQICRAAPVTLNSSVRGPTLAETMHFIEDMFNDNGAVNYRLKDEKREFPAFYQRLTEAKSDPSRCQIRFNRRAIDGAVDDYRKVISFPRVEKLEVSTEEDYVNRSRASAVKVEPEVYRLSVTYVGGERLALHFRDEEMANRIARAMNHAAEVCGGGSKDPF